MILDKVVKCLDRVPLTTPCVEQEVPSWAGMSRVTCLIRERQLRFYGHVVRFPMDDPARRILTLPPKAVILTAMDPAEWNRRRVVPTRA